MFSDIVRESVMRSMIRSAFIAACVAVTWGTVVGCDRDDDIATPPSGGELVFQDGFEDGDLGPEWTTGYEGWEIVDGTLHVAGAHNDALWLQEPLPEQFRVSFSARSESSQGDIKFEILGDGETHESGYIGIFGGWDNSLNIIARLDEHGDDRLEGASTQRVERGRTYEMDVVRTDGRLRWYVDGELFLSYEDAAPLRGEGHRHFAFNNWETPLYFNDFRVYDLGAAEESAN